MVDTVSSLSQHSQFVPVCHQSENSLQEGGLVEAWHPCTRVASVPSWCLLRGTGHRGGPLCGPHCSSVHQHHKGTRGGASSLAAPSLKNQPSRTLEFSWTSSEERQLIRSRFPVDHFGCPSQRQQELQNKGGSVAEPLLCQNIHEGQQPSRCHGGRRL